MQAITTGRRAKPWKALEDITGRGNQPRRSCRNPILKTVNLLFKDLKEM